MFLWFVLVVSSSGTTVCIAPDLPPADAGVTELRVKGDEEVVEVMENPGQRTGSGGSGGLTMALTAMVMVSETLRRAEQPSRNLGAISHATGRTFKILIVTGNSAFADYRYGEEDGISPSTLICPATKDQLVIYALNIPPD